MGELVPFYKWARKVKERDGYKCAFCGATEKLEAHHIEQQAKNGARVCDLSNGITLCHNCHRTAHNCNYTTRQWNGHGESERYLEIQRFIRERNKCDFM